MTLLGLRDGRAAVETRHYTLIGASAGPLRSARWDGKPHLVVPVVALVGDVVLEALGASGPEFVPAAVVERSAGGWNGEPVVVDHPIGADGTLLSANDPEALERACYGRVFHPRWENGRLCADAYLDVEKAERVGAGETIARLRAGEAVEISIGAGVQTLARAGEHGGRRYVSVWTSILPDHLAIGLGGGTGACSIEMGCGAGSPRAARYRLTTDGSGLVPQEDGMTVPAVVPTPAAPGVLARLRGALGSLLPAGPPEDQIRAAIRAAEVRGAEGESDMDVRRELSEELRHSVPAFMGVDAVFPDEGLVVYVCETKDGGYSHYRRPFELKDGKASLAGEPEEVKPVTKFEPVGARAAIGTPDVGQRAACTCQDPPNSGEKQGVRMAGTPATKERVQALIENPRSPFKAADEAMLLGTTGERLAEWETTFAATAAPTTAAAPAAAPEQTTIPAAAAPPVTTAPAEPVAVAARQAPATNQISDEELARMRAALRREDEREAAAKAALVAQVRGAQSVYDDARLNAMTSEQLAEVAALLGVAKPVDYSLRSAPRAAEGADVAKNEPPDTWGLNKKKAVA